MSEGEEVKIVPKTYAEIIREMRERTRVFLFKKNTIHLIGYIRALLQLPSDYAVVVAAIRERSFLLKEHCEYGTQIILRRKDGDYIFDPTIITEQKSGEE